jgi:hypothetical protein
LQNVTNANRNSVAPQMVPTVFYGHDILSFS